MDQMFGYQPQDSGQSLNPQGYEVKLKVHGESSFTVCIERPDTGTPNLDTGGMGQSFGSTQQEEHFSSLEQAMYKIVDIVNGR